MINATHMGKAFGKKPNDFLKVEQTKEFIKALELKSNIIAFKTVKGRHHAGTWMHKKLALKFAGWLNPEFELWVYDRIEELLTNGYVQAKKTEEGNYNINPNQLLEALNSMANLQTQCMQMMQAQQTQFELLVNERSKQMQPIMEAQSSAKEAVQVALTPTEISKMLKMEGGGKALNDFLKKKKVQYKKNNLWHLYPEYEGLGYAEHQPQNNPKGGSYLSLVWLSKGVGLVKELVNENKPVENAKAETGVKLEIVENTHTYDLRVKDIADKLGISVQRLNAILQKMGLICNKSSSSKDKVATDKLIRNGWGVTAYQPRKGPSFVIYSQKGFNHIVRKVRKYGLSDLKTKKLSEIRREEI
jgi:phage antirepressor YoqD-like protein